jgi:hypothetical protein
MGKVRKTQKHQNLEFIKEKACQKKKYINIQGGIETEKKP